MKQSEVLELAMERIIDKMRETEITDEQHQKLNKQLKELAYMFVIAEQKERE